ncbi:MAG: asparagine synthase (glutamine-hydrolyzing) [Chitinophagaceae bacterium]|nr:asparagine synthase (glutamine-hydrolyzing) [Chitinophagaceae bacterium]
MCGVSGIIKSPNGKVELEELKKINDKITHRGPDAEGFFMYENVGLGHRRLSILDLTEAGNQPMVYLNDFIITYNGEVYNYIELRNELADFGYKFSTNTDTEVILASYHKWGVDCLSKFNGMWSFAILDLNRKTVFIARDRFGVKPLYYSENSGSFVFGSEIKQLLNDDENYVNLDALVEYMLTYIDNHSERTYFSGIYSLLPGHYLIYDLSTLSYVVNRYYELSLKKDIESLKGDKAVQYIRQLLNSAINFRLRSDVKVGTCLSGGLDSSAVSAIANHEYRSTASRKFTAIHAKSIDSITDESSFAKIVSNYLDLDLHIVTPTTEDFKRLIEEVIYTQEEPFGSPSMFMGYQVFSKAKELGCKVMLNGQGGDEVLLGYERYFSSYLYQVGFWKGLKELWKQAQNSGLKLYEPILYFFYFTSFKIRKKRLLRRSFLKKEIKQGFDFKEIKRIIDSFQNISKLQIHEITIVQLPHLLRYEDRNSMRHSIETRLPFLDYRMVEAGISLSPELKIFNGWTKYVLRLAIKNLLPDNIVWRKSKLGFNAPERIWLANHIDEMILQIRNSELLETITDLNSLISNFTRLSYKEQWLYYNIAVWEKVYKIKLGHK